MWVRVIACPDRGTIAPYARGLCEADFALQRYPRVRQVERLCDLLTERGIQASWALEESAGRPVMPRARGSRSAEPDFPLVCLDAWREFVDNHDQVAILDGYGLQSTDRFLYANLIHRTGIEAYLRAWQALASGDSAMVFFRVEDPAAHFDQVLEERGEDWASKLFAYVERTSVAIRHGLWGKAGIVAFWAGYQALCLDLCQELCQELP